MAVFHGDMLPDVACGHFEAMLTNIPAGIALSFVVPLCGCHPHEGCIILPTLHQDKVSAGGQSSRSLERLTTPSPESPAHPDMDG